MRTGETISLIKIYYLKKYYFFFLTIEKAFRYKKSEAVPSNSFSSLQRNYFDKGSVHSIYADTSATLLIWE